ncbi:MAG TPA: AMP-binding protein, partial [Chitinophagaceae bacterium]|nr:AMP-binding protein [Chitinophagaceae bacterium]
MQIERLFDILTSYVTRLPDKPMLHHKAEGIWHSLSATEVQQKVQQVAASFVRMGNNTHLNNIEAAEKIAIIANNRPEWVIVDFATQLSGAVLVPIYPSVTEQEWSYMLQEAN